MCNVCSTVNNPTFTHRQSDLRSKLWLFLKQLALPKVRGKVFGVPLKRNDIDGLMQGAVLTQKWPLGSTEQHALIYKGDIERLVPGQEVLIRINSACYTGDIFHDQSCDCNEQLEVALKMLTTFDGPGLVLYHIEHEGKAHGYFEKLKSFDGEMYPVKGDRRDFRTAVSILMDLGIRRVRVMTNNPEKVGILREYGLEVTGIVPIVSEDPNLRRFFDYKARVWNHALPRLAEEEAA